MYILEHSAHLPACRSVHVSLQPHEERLPRGVGDPEHTNLTHLFYFPTDERKVRWEKIQEEEEEEEEKVRWENIREEEEEKEEKGGGKKLKRKKEGEKEDKEKSRKREKKKKRKKNSRMRRK